MAVLAPTVVFQQPQSTSVAPVNSNQWSSGICDCFDDCYVCCFATCCFPVFACSTAADFGEWFCLPVMDFPCYITQCLGFSMYTPPIAMALRASVRNRYGIQGDLATDCLYSTFCNVCSWCQISREIKRRRAAFTVVNTQAAPVTPPVGINSQATVISQSTVTTSHVG